MIYCVFITPFLLLVFMEACCLEKKYIKLLLPFFTIVLMLFIGLRYKTGRDWGNYLRFFESIPHNRSTGFEPGYIWLNRIIYYTFGNYFVVQFIAIFLILYGYYKFLKKHAQFPIFSLCLFFIFFFFDILMSQVRQSIAMGIILLGVENIFERKFTKYLCYTLTASLFHVSAIFAIPIYFLYNYTARVLPIFLMLFCTLSYFYTDIVYFMVAKIVLFLPGRLGTIALVYLDSEIYGGKPEFGTGLGYIGNFLMNLFIVSLCKTRDKRLRFFINCMIIAQIISSISTGFSIIQRFRAYYLMFGIIGYENLFRMFSFKKMANLFYVYVCIIILFFAIPFYKARTSHDHDRLTGNDVYFDYNPYYNVFVHPYEAEFKY